MNQDEKILENVAKIIKVTGFHITSKGDESVGIFDSRWELSNEFFFDDKEELELFRNDLKQTFENYCGIVTVETFEERQALIDTEF
jgi:hypothetical protein